MKKRCQCPKCAFEVAVYTQPMPMVAARKSLTSVRILFARHNIPEPMFDGPFRYRSRN